MSLGFPASNASLTVIIVIDVITVCHGFVPELGMFI